MKGGTMKKSLLIPIVTVLVIGGAGLTAASAVRADDTASSQNSFVSRLAERFGLDATEVQTFMQEEHETRQAERQAERQTRLEERLTQAVSEGSISEEQKQLLLNKHAELQAEREANRPEMGEMHDLTDEERAAKRAERQATGEAKRAELEAWAHENGIDLSLLMPEKGERGEGFGHKAGRGPGMF